MTASEWSQHTSYIVGYLIILLAVTGVHGISFATVARRARARDDHVQFWDRMIAVMNEDPTGRRWVAHPVRMVIINLLIVIVLGGLLGARLATWRFT